MTSPQKIIADVSFAHEVATGAALVALGISGVIGYAGCNDTRKNVPPARYADWLANGLEVGLVIENAATDMNLGAATGAAQGKAIAASARALGHTGLVLTSADWNVSSAQVANVIAAQSAFEANVGNLPPGIYSNQRTLDAWWAVNPRTILWQSDSTSFSNGTSIHAHAQQLYNDPRAKNLSADIDISSVLKTPMFMQGETHGGFMYEIVREPVSTAEYQTDGLLIFRHIGSVPEVQVLQESPLCQPGMRQVTASDVATMVQEVAYNQASLFGAEQSSLTALINSIKVNPSVDPAAFAAAVMAALKAQFDKA